MDRTNFNSIIECMYEKITKTLVREITSNV